MGFIADLFGYLLNYLYDWVQNYGLAIILFSFILQVILLPLSIKQQKSMKKSAKIQQEMQKLQVKYKNNPELLNQEVMGLYKKEKVSPFSGCLSSIIQLIIFLSVFYLVSQPLTHMRKVDPALLEKYSKEITESGQSSSYPEIKIIEQKADEDENVYINMDFLGLDLSKVPMQNLSDIRVLIIPILYVITTFINIKIMTNLNKSKEQWQKEKEEKERRKQKNALTDGSKKEEEGMDEQLQSMQQMTNSMNYMMPIMSIAIAVIAPLGLSLYWLVKNILQFCERLVLNKVMKKENEEA